MVGLGGLLARERMQLVRERALLAHERARRLEVETALAARDRIPRTSTPIAATEPPAPDSYLMLTSRMARGVADAPWPVDDRPAAPAGPSTRSPEPSSRPVPLRPDDVRRVLDL